MAQNDKILEYLREHTVIDRFKARDLCGCERLASRIAELKQGGHDIRTVMQYDRNRFGDPVKWAEYVYWGEGKK